MHIYLQAFQLNLDKLCRLQSLSPVINIIQYQVEPHKIKILICHRCPYDRLTLLAHQAW